MRAQPVADSRDGDFVRFHLPVVSGIFSPERLSREREFVQQLSQVREFLDQFRSLGMDEREDALPGALGGQRFRAFGEGEDWRLGEDWLGVWNSHWEFGLSGLHTADGQPLAKGWPAP